MAPSDWVALASGFGGALLGAVVGGAIAWMIAKKERYERRKAGAYRALLKASRMLSDFANIKSAIDDDIQKAELAGQKEAETWTKVTPLVGGFKPLTIELDDLVVFVEAKEYQIYDDMVQLEMHHSATCHAIDEYGRLRAEFRDIVPTHGGSGNTLYSGMTREVYDQVRVRMLEMNTLIESLMPLLTEYVADARSLVRRLGPAARKALKDKDFPLMGTRDEKK